MALEVIKLHTGDGQLVEVSLYAGHVLSWKTKDGEDLLFMSSKAIREPPKAIRGGIPICWPQFGAYGPMGQHGFARNVQWQVEDQTAYSVTLTLTYDGKAYEQYPHPFKLKTSIAICDNTLQQELIATNTGDSEMPFTCALHTYYKVSDVAQVQVEGLQGLDYLDSTAGKARCKEGAAHVMLAGEVDRIYLHAPDTIKVTDPAAHRCFTIAKQGFPDAVLWNPHIAKAQSMSDFGDDEWPGMVCLEPAVAASGPVVLQPGQMWTAGQQLSVSAV